MSYQNKYLKYKNKYLDLKKQIGGSSNSQKSMISLIQDGATVEEVNALIQLGVSLNIKDDQGRTALMLASEKGNQAIVDSLINAGVSIELQDKQGKTALMLALEKGHTSIVESLERAKLKEATRRAKVKEAMRHGESTCAYCLDPINCYIQTNINLECGCCLHVECLCSNVNSLIDNSKQNTNFECPTRATTNHEGTSYTDLMRELIKISDETCKEKLNSLIEKLKENIEFISSPSKSGEIDKFVLLTAQACPTCGFYATHSHGHACHHKLSNRFNKSSGCEHEFCYVCGSDKLAHECYYHETYVGDNWNTWCKETITEKDIDYSTGIPRDNRCGCTFCNVCSFNKPCSACNGNCLVCKGVVKPGPLEVLPESDRHGWFIPKLASLIIPSKEGNLSLVESLIQAGADVNMKEQVFKDTPLIIASIHRHANIVDALITAGADVNVINNHKRNALISAISTWQYRASLSNAIKNANIQDNTAKIAFEHSFKNEYKNKSEAIVNALIKKGADLNIQDNFGRTALMIALEEGNKAIVDALITGGANVNILSKNNTSALMIASENGYGPIVDALINAGADVNVKNLSGETALTKASIKGHTAIVDSLREAMKRV